MDLHYQGKVVLITGALGGIGRGLVRRFQEEGAEVVAASSRPPNQAAEELAKAFPRPPRYVMCDYTKPETIPAAISSANPDIVVANAAVTTCHLVTEASLEDWNRLVAVNFTGNFLLGQSAARHLAAKRAGAILFIGSLAQCVPKPNTGAYGPTKAGMRMLALCLAKELAPLGVRVNILIPGVIDTGMAARNMVLQPERREWATQVTLCGHLGTAEEVADAAVFLCSSRANFIYGAELLIDGGAALGSF